MTKRDLLRMVYEVAGVSPRWRNGNGRRTVAGGCKLCGTATDLIDVSWHESGTEFLDLHLNIGHTPLCPGRIALRNHERGMISVEGAAAAVFASYVSGERSPELSTRLTTLSEDPDYHPMACAVKTFVFLNGELVDGCFMADEINGEVSYYVQDEDGNYCETYDTRTGLRLDSATAKGDVWMLPEYNGHAREKYVHYHKNMFDPRSSAVRVDRL